MKTRTLFIVGVATMATVGSLGAQQSGGSTATQGQAGQGSISVTGCLKRADQASSTSGSGATGTSGSGSTAAGSQSGSGSGDRFILTNAAMGQSSPGGTSSTSGTKPGATSGSAGSTSGAAGSQDRSGSASDNRANAAGSSASGSTYVLEGRESELRNHVDHQVQITGRLHAQGTGAGAGGRDTSAGSQSGATGTAGTATRSGEASRGGESSATGSGIGASGAQRLNVESVKMIASACSSR